MLKLLEERRQLRRIQYEESERRIEEEYQRRLQEIEEAYEKAVQRIELVFCASKEAIDGQFGDANTRTTLGRQSVVNCTPSTSAFNSNTNISTVLVDRQSLKQCASVRVKKQFTISATIQRGIKIGSETTNGNCVCSDRLKMKKWIAAHLANKSPKMSSQLIQFVDMEKHACCPLSRRSALLGTNNRSRMLVYEFRYSVHFVVFDPGGRNGNKFLLIKSTCLDRLDIGSYNESIDRSRYTTK